MARRTTKQVRKILWAYAQLHGPDALSAYAGNTRKRLIGHFLEQAQAREALYRQAASSAPSAETLARPGDSGASGTFMVS